MKKRKQSVNVIDPKTRITEVRKVRAEDIAAHPGNWRDHPEAQAEAIAGVMREVGDVGVLLAWHSERNGGKLTLIDGHLRRGIAPGHEYHVAITDLSDAEADYVLATHDPLAGMAIPDAAALDALLSTVNSSEEGVQKMLADLAKAAGLDYAGDQADAEPKVDQAEELNKKWQVETGQVWRVGEHRLLCGDSTRAADVARLMQGDKAAMMVTDPPYGVSYDPSWRMDKTIHDGNKPDGYSLGTVQNDNVSNWTGAWQLFEGNVAYVWHASLAIYDVWKSLADAGFVVRNQIIWAKHQHQISRGHYHWQHEPCLYVVRDGASAAWIGDRKQTTVWQIQNHAGKGGEKDDGKTLHSTQKPLECMARPIRNHDAAIIYDPFCGSGTTLVACQNIGRQGRAIEISPNYCAVILERMAQAFPNLTIEKAG